VRGSVCTRSVGLRSVPTLARRDPHRRIRRVRTRVVRVLLETEIKRTRIARLQARVQLLLYGCNQTYHYYRNYAGSRARIHSYSNIRRIAYAYIHMHSRIPAHSHTWLACTQHMLVFTTSYESNNCYYAVLIHLTVLTKNAGQILN
jgi:hypothetical protein